MIVMYIMQLCIVHLYHISVNLAVQLRKGDAIQSRVSCPSRHWRQIWHLWTVVLTTGLNISFTCTDRYAPKSRDTCSWNVRSVWPIVLKLVFVSPAHVVDHGAFIFIRDIAFHSWPLNWVSFNKSSVTWHWALSHMVPTWTGKPRKMGKLFPVREK